MDVKKLSLFRDLLFTKSVADNKTDSQGKSGWRKIFLESTFDFNPEAATNGFIYKRC